MSGRRFCTFCKAMVSAVDHDPCPLMVALERVKESASRAGRRRKRVRDGVRQDDGSDTSTDVDGGALPSGVTYGVPSGRNASFSIMKPETHSRRSASPSTSSTGSSSNVSSALPLPLGVGLANGFPPSSISPPYSNSNDASDRVMTGLTTGGGERKAGGGIAATATPKATATATVTWAGTARKVVKNRCPACGLEFERLYQHLYRNPVCSKSSEGKAELKRILAHMTRPSKSHKKGASAGRPGAGAAVAAAEAFAALSAAAAKRPSTKDSCSGSCSGSGSCSASGAGASAGAGRTQKGGQAIQAKARQAVLSGNDAREPVTLLPCPVCGNFFQRVGTHLNMNEPCKVYNRCPAGSKMRCKACDMLVGITDKELKRHAKHECPVRSTATVGPDGMVGAPSTATTATLSDAGSVSLSLARSTSTGSASSAKGGGRKSQTNGGGTGPGSKGSGRRASPSSLSGSTGSGSGGGGGRASPSPGPNGVPNGGRGGGGSGSGDGGGAVAPPRLKRRNSNASSSNGGSSGSLVSGGGAGGRRGSCFGTSSSSAADRRLSVGVPELRKSSSFFDRVLNSDSDSSSASEDDIGRGGGFGVGGGGTAGGGIIGSTRRPLPPRKRWETEFELWAERGRVLGGGRGHSGAGGISGAGATGDKLGEDEEAAAAAAAADEVDERYPWLMNRADKSSLVTIREVRRAGVAGDKTGVSGVGGTGGVGGGRSQGREAEQQWSEAVLECKLAVSRGGLEAKAIAGSPRAGPGANAGVAVAVALGIEVKTGKESGHPLAGYPVVGSVVAGGLAEGAGVVSGAVILQVDQATMQQKSPADMIKTMSATLKKKPKNREHSIRLVIVTPAWLMPPPPPWLVQPPPRPDHDVDALSPRGPVLGGMASLPREEQRGKEFIEMCWSVLMYPEGGVPPAAFPQGFDALALEERPVEQDEEVARRLGFDVERRELSEDMECIEVVSVEEGSIAAKHGLLLGDLILAVDGRHLLSSSEPSFWLEVGRTLRACDAIRELKRRKTNSGMAMPTSQERQQQHSPRSLSSLETTISGTTFPTDLDENAWLRFLLVRKRTAPPPPAKPKVASGIARDSSRGKGTVGERNNHAKEVDFKVVEGKHGAPPDAEIGIPARVIPAEKSMEEPPEASADVAGIPEGNVATFVATGRGSGNPEGSTSSSNSGASSSIRSSTSSAGRTRRTSPADAHPDDKLKRLEIRKRPAWWLPYVKGSHRQALCLRPSHVRGVNRDPGAFLVEPTRLGDKMVIPAGAKLISVDEKQTGHLEFKEARAVALSAGKHSVLRFES